MFTFRNPQYPILAPADISPSSESMQVECLLNPGAFRFDGKVFLLLRVAERPRQVQGEISFPYLSPDGRIKVIRISKQDPGLDMSDPRVINWNGDDYLTTMSHLRLVSSEDGIYFTEDTSFPVLFPEGRHESYGIEDCRVAFIEGKWYLTYTAVSSNGVAVGMRSTSDWKSFTNHGLILPPHNKDCALFEEKIGGKYLILHRPSSPEIGGNYIWIAESPDLLHWGGHQCLAKTRRGSWDSASPFEDWFAGGNEPSFQIPWIYNWVGRPDKTSGTIRRILDELYFVGEGGVPGNDDMGTMGAWYVFACIGMYPMIPGVGGFTLNTPAFERIVIHLPGGDLTIKAGPEQNLYTTSLKVNGKHRGRAWIDLEEIEKGGTIEYGTASKPGSWGKSELPPSFE